MLRLKIGQRWDQGRKVDLVNLEVGLADFSTILFFSIYFSTSHGLTSPKSTKHISKLAKPTLMRRTSENAN